MKALPQKRSVFFPNLDGLRFFAFFAVFLNHFFHHFKPVEHPFYEYLEILFTLNYQGNIVGVYFFFTLSGFLITYLILNEIEVNGKLDVKAFYIRRSLRIWPLYYLVLLVGFVVHPLLAAWNGTGFTEEASPWLYGTYLANFDIIYQKSPVSAILGVQWSVCIEEQFYLLWPLIFFILPKRSYLYMFLTFLVAALIFRMQYVGNFNMLYYQTLNAFNDLALGGLTAWIAFTYRDQMERFFNKLSRWLILAAYLGGAVLIFYKVKLFTLVPGMEVMYRLLLSGFFAFVILEQNYAKHSLFKMSKWKVISKLGKYTYGLYLMHMIGILSTIWLSGILGLEQSYPVMIFQFVLALAISIGISIGSYHGYENYFLKLKRKFSYLKTT